MRKIGSVSGVPRPQLMYRHVVGTMAELPSNCKPSYACHSGIATHWAWLARNALALRLEVTPTTGKECAQ